MRVGCALRRGPDERLQASFRSLQPLRLERDRSRGQVRPGCPFRSGRRRSSASRSPVSRRRTGNFDRRHFANRGENKVPSTEEWGGPQRPGIGGDSGAAAPSPEAMRLLGGRSLGRRRRGAGWPAPLRDHRSGLWAEAGSGYAAYAGARGARVPLSGWHLPPGAEGGGTAAEKGKINRPKLVIC